MHYEMTRLEIIFETAVPAYIDNMCLSVCICLEVFQSTCDWSLLFGFGLVVECRRASSTDDTLALDLYRQIRCLSRVNIGEMISIPNVSRSRAIAWTPWTANIRLFHGQFASWHIILSIMSAELTLESDTHIFISAWTSYA
jgi:hypothetical protein